MDSLRENLLLPVKRRSSWSHLLYADLRDSPLHNLVPIAQPGVTSRVSHCQSVGKSLEVLGDAFTPGETSETVVKVQGGYTGPLLVAAAVAVLPALQYGFNAGNMNTASAAMRMGLGIPSGQSQYSDSLWGFCISVFCLGALQGCVVGASLADSFGRRCTLVTASCAYALGALLEAASCLPGRAGLSCGVGVALMILGRAISGTASGATTVVVPMYLGEISPPHLRGAFGTLFQLMACIAMLTAEVLGLPCLLGTQDTWPLYVLLATLPALVLVILQSLLVESPRWLVSQGSDNYEAAQDVLAYLRGELQDDISVTQELDFMYAQTGASSGCRVGQVLGDPGVRPGLVICVCCSVVQQFSGINNVFNYSSTFLVQNGISVATVNLITLLMNVGNVFVTLLSTYLMDRAGRRTLLLASSIGMLLSTLVLTFVLSSPSCLWTAPAAVLAVVSFVASFGIGLGPVPWLLPAELFPQDKCAMGSAVAASCNWLANFVAGQAFLPMTSALHGFCFLPFAVVLLLFVYFVHHAVPETRGKTLEQILDDVNFVISNSESNRTAQCWETPPAPVGARWGA